jgi:hypothetical protein
MNVVVKHDSAIIEKGSDGYVSIKELPNGFTSWVETHFEISLAIGTNANSDTPTEKLDNLSTGEMYELVQDLTDEFEKLHEGREWEGGDYWDELNNFLMDKVGVTTNN